MDAINRLLESVDATAAGERFADAIRRLHLSVEQLAADIRRHRAEQPPEDWANARKFD